MKKKFFLLLFLVSGSAVFSQTQPTDTNYATSITAIEWLPDGNAMLLSIVKYHKTNRQAPFFSKVYRFDLRTNKAEEMFENGSNLAPSPDGKTIAFLKRDDKRRSDIYLYNTGTNKETVLRTDTTRKNSLSWSPDGKKLMYNISYNGIGQYSTIDVCVLDLATSKIKQVTQSGLFKSYSPVWCPDSRKIVYYLEKGDGRDQIWLTDIEGSFHTNLTDDTTTHNFFPSWLDKKTIIYTQSPESIMTMNIDGRNKQKVEGLKSYLVKFNSAVGLLAYIAPSPDKKVIVYDWKRKTSRILLDEPVLNSVW